CVNYRDRPWPPPFFLSPPLRLTWSKIATALGLTPIFFHAGRSPHSGLVRLSSDTMVTDELAREPYPLRPAHLAQAQRPPRQIARRHSPPVRHDGSVRPAAAARNCNDCPRCRRRPGRQHRDASVPGRSARSLPAWGRLLRRVAWALPRLHLADRRRRAGPRVVHRLSAGARASVSGCGR